MENNVVTVKMRFFIPQVQCLFRKAKSMESIPPFVQRYIEILSMPGTLAELFNQITID
jgi:hypothetical protein